MKCELRRGARIWFSVALLLWIIQSTEGNGCRVLDFNPEISEGRLKNHVIDTKKASAEDFCQVLCYMNDKCVSINFNQTQDEDGLHSCELNDSDKERHPKDLEKKDGFSYRASKNPCNSSPCFGNATCQTGYSPKGFNCICPPGYTGEMCETAVGLLFPKEGVTDYVTCPNCTVPSLQGFTICFWVCINETEKNLAYFSYFVDKNDILIGSNKKEPRMAVADTGIAKQEDYELDGAWHHICYTWNSTGGSWQNYKDGALYASDAGFNENTIIEGGGTVVLGQDQDKREGGFDKEQSFVGVLSGVNVWDHVIPSDKISRMYKSCTADEGNVIKWPDFMSGIKGNVQIIKPSYCKANTVRDQRERGDLQPVFLGP